MNIRKYLKWTGLIILIIIGTYACKDMFSPCNISDMTFDFSNIIYLSIGIALIIFKLLSKILRVDHLFSKLKKINLTVVVLLSAACIILQLVPFLLFVEMLDSKIVFTFYSIILSSLIIAFFGAKRGEEASLNYWVFLLRIVMFISLGISAYYMLSIPGIALAYIVLSFMFYLIAHLLKHVKTRGWLKTHFTSIMSQNQVPDLSQA